MNAISTLTAKCLAALAGMLLAFSVAAQGGWTPSEEQKARAEDTAARFLGLRDEAKYAEAYDMLSPGLRRMMPLRAFTQVEESFAAKAGGDPIRTGTRVTWYKDPPQAPVPGVYAAFNIECRYRNVNICEDILILHEQADGSFWVIRQERNFIDKETEERLRRRKGAPS